MIVGRSRVPLSREVNTGVFLLQHRVEKSNFTFLSPNSRSENVVV